jgi:hypothetical protein
VSESLVSRRNLVGKVLSDPEAKVRVESLLQEQKARARGVLSNNRDLVTALRDALIARDELVGDEILHVLDAALARRGVKGDPLIVLPDAPSGADRWAAE